MRVVGVQESTRRHGRVTTAPRPHRAGTGVPAHAAVRAVPVAGPALGAVRRARNRLHERTAEDVLVAVEAPHRLNFGDELSAPLLERLTGRRVTG